MDCNRLTTLLVGPDAAARTFLADHLSADGHDVLVAAGAAAGSALLASGRCDLVLLDATGGPHGARDALELLARIRQGTRTGAGIDAGVPVLTIVPRLGEVDRLRLFERGTDDLLTAPVSYPELRARIGALLRRSRGELEAVRVRIGPLEIDAGAQEVWLEGQAVALAHREYELLRALASAPERVFSRAELLERVWRFHPGDRTRTLDVHASRLRRKLAHPTQRFVVNVWGQGYRLTEPVPSTHPVGSGQVTSLSALRGRPQAPVDAEDVRARRFLPAA